jgi:hypothetical protein
MNHGESLDATERSFFPLVEFRDAAFWFARRGNLVVVPIRPGFARSAIDLPERGLLRGDQSWLVVAHDGLRLGYCCW